MDELAETYTLLPQIGTIGYVLCPEAISYNREN
jgi:hypothetical protein